MKTDLGHAGVERSPWIGLRVANSRAPGLQHHGLRLDGPEDETVLAPEQMPTDRPLSVLGMGPLWNPSE